MIVFPFPGRPNGRPVTQEGVLGRFVKPIERHELFRALRGSETREGKLLVVDDDPAMARFVARLMASPDAHETGLWLETSAAYTGAQALDEIRTNAPDLAMLDLMLPDTNGWELLDDLDQRGVPAILMAGHENQFVPPEETRDALRASMSRPLARQELLNVLSTLLADVRPVYPPLPDLAA